MIGAVVLCVAAGGWIFLRKSDAQEPTLQTAEVTQGDLQILISAAGSLTPKETVDVGAQVSGQLQALLVEAGDHVEEGQLLAQIDATLAQSQVDADRAQLKESQANYSQQQAQVELAQSVFDRAANLNGSQVIKYMVSPDDKWAVVIGIAPGAPERPSLVKGYMQLYSMEQKRSQALEAHAAAFASLKVAGNTEPSTLMTLAQSRS